MSCIRFLSGIIFIMLLAVIKVNGQEEGSRKGLKYFEKAQYYFQSGQYKDCENELNKAILADSNLAGAYILLGDVFLEIGKPSEAIDQYIRALNFNPERVEVVYNLLANTLFSLERYAEASRYYGKLLSLPDIKPDLRTAIEINLKNSRARETLIENPVSYNPVNLGPHINTEADEYINSISASDSGIFFTRRMKSGAGNGREYIEDFYFGEINGDTLVNAIKLNYPPGKENDAGAICLSPDGRLLFFTSCFRTDSYGSCDLYFSEKVGDTWTVAKNMGASINTDSWEAQPSISPDGKTLYFASNRKGSAGSSDIWKTERTPGGGWNKPVNIGIPVNTAEAEMAPFIHYDNQTLYFSSGGHAGMGGADLFKTIRGNGNWSQPVNLGFPINSSADELVIVVNPEGNQGLISSNSLKGEGGYDIFIFDLYEAIRPIPVTYLKGKVYDKLSGLPLEAKIELIDIEQNYTIINISSDKLNGEFLACMPVNRNYALNVSCDGYLFYSENFPLSQIKSQLDPVIKDIPLEPVAVGNTIVLRNIFFNSDEFQLEPESFTELNKLFDFLQANPSIRVEIGGHTDGQGTNEYNIELSQKRADAVCGYLVSQGSDPARMSCKGYGESKPVSINDTEEGKALNRRTEITVLKSD